MCLFIYLCMCMYMCVHVCVCARSLLCMHVLLYVHICVYVCVCVCLWVCMFVFVCVWLYLRMYNNVCMCLFGWLCVHISTRMLQCVSTSVCLCSLLYICTSWCIDGSMWMCYIVIYMFMQHHNDTIIKTLEGRRKKTSLEKYSPLTLLQGFERVVEGLHVRGCWRPNINFIFWPHRYDHYVVSFLFSWCWGPLHRGFPRAPLVGCGLPYHIWSLLSGILLATALAPQTQLS